VTMTITTAVATGTMAIAVEPIRANINTVTAETRTKRMVVSAGILMLRLSQRASSKV